MYAIINLMTNKLEDDGMGCTLFFTDKARVEESVKIENLTGRARYLVVEAKALAPYSLVDDVVLITPDHSIEKCIEMAINESPERKTAIEVARAEILSMQIQSTPFVIRPDGEYSFRMSRNDGGDWGNTGYMCSGLYADPIEMMSDAAKVVGNDLKARMGRAGDVEYALEPYRVARYLDKEFIGYQPAADFSRAYRLVDLLETDRIIFGDAKLGISDDVYDIESIETASGKVENAGSLIVLKGPGPDVLTLHAGDFLKSDVTFLKKPEALRGAKPF